jgi:predicted methyltransferase
MDFLRSASDASQDVVASIGFVPFHLARVEVPDFYRELYRVLRSGGGAVHDLNNSPKAREAALNEAAAAGFVVKLIDDEEAVLLTKPLLR